MEGQAIAFVMRNGIGIIMQNKRNNSLLEPIVHVTGSLPFSFHHTMKQNSEIILYLHWHCEIELLYIESGETLFCVEGNEYPLKAGDAIFIPSNLLHMAKRLNDSDCEFYAFVFSPSLISESYKNPFYAQYIFPIMHHSLRFCLHLTPDIPWHKPILNDLKAMYYLSFGGKGQWELQVHGMLLILWQMLYNNHLSKIEVVGNYSRLSTQLEDAIDFIHNNFDDDITLKKLAGLSNLSEGQFCRLFKELTGSTPFRYLNRYRIFRSCEYLSNTTKKIAEIATLCGFNNISYYNREFINIMKTTPSSYRKIIH